jgi:hypothetical protein
MISFTMEDGSILKPACALRRWLCPVWFDVDLEMYDLSSSSGWLDNDWDHEILIQATDRRYYLIVWGDDEEDVISALPFDAQEATMWLFESNYPIPDDLREIAIAMLQEDLREIEPGGSA